MTTEVTFYAMCKWPDRSYPVACRKFYLGADGCLMIFDPIAEHYVPARALSPSVQRRLKRLAGGAK